MEPELSRTQKVCKTICVIAIINFVLFMIICLIIGGDALNGYQKDGHFYLSNHGKHPEVSGFIWYCNRMHALSVFITHLCAIIAAPIYKISKKKSSK